MTSGPEVDGIELLPCGREPHVAWDHARAGAPDAHEWQCPYCTAVREQYETLAAASSAYLGEPAVLPAGLVDSVMRTVRAELRPGRPLPLPTPVGTATVIDTAMANALRLVLDGDPAVVAHRLRIEPAELPDGADGVRPLHIWISVSISYEHYSAHGDRTVRDRVTESAAQLFGQRLSRVDIDVVDVFTTRAGGDR